MSERDDLLMTSDHEALRDTLAPYAFGTLDHTAAARVEAHLAACPECASAVADYQAVVRALPLVLPLSQPPAGARERLLARARSASAAADAGDAPSVRPRRSWFRVPRVRPAALRLAAVAMLLLAVTGGGVALRAEFGEREPSYRWVVSLRASELAPEATGAIVFRGDGGASLLVNDLPALPPDHVYEFWFADREQEWFNGGSFHVDEQGEARIPVEVPPGLGSYTWVCVTAQPAGEGPALTDHIMLRASLFA
jgi:anti-sigma factor RsiW